MATHKQAYTYTCNNNHPIARAQPEDKGGYCKVVRTVSKVALEYTAGLVLIARICELRVFLEFANF